MTPLGSILLDRIRKEGPVSVETFMNLALSHPEHGYYMVRDPLGANGDFTTAPEISQIFGELLGAWVADVWIRSGQPGEFTLVECGPGRGTLMSDMIRATKSVKGFHEALRVVLLETSPVLMEAQKKALLDYKGMCRNIDWARDLSSPLIQSAEGPVVFVANEFLDALPICQLVCHRQNWFERTVEVNAAGEISFGNLPYKSQIAVPVTGQEADIYEYSPVREDFVRTVCRIIKEKSGAALLIDYGHDKAGIGDTLQAVKNHEYVPVLSHIGEADLTAHVDFAALVDIAEKEGVQSGSPIEQSVFLNSLGIQFRAQALLKNASPAQKEDIIKGVNRLTSADQMGRLFKVLMLHA